MSLRGRAFWWTSLTLCSRMAPVMWVDARLLSVRVTVYRIMWLWSCWKAQKQARRRKTRIAQIDNQPPSPNQSLPSKPLTVVAGKRHRSQSMLANVWFPSYHCYHHGYSLCTQTTKLTQNLLSTVDVLFLWCRCHQGLICFFHMYIVEVWPPAVLIA